MVALQGQIRLPFGFEGAELSEDSIPISSAAIIRSEDPFILYIRFPSLQSGLIFSIAATIL